VREECFARERAIAHLDQVDAARDRGLDARFEIGAARGAVRHQAEAGARNAQNVARPSSGLDAFA